MTHEVIKIICHDFEIDFKLGLSETQVSYVVEKYLDHTEAMHIKELQRIRNAVEAELMKRVCS